MANPVGAIANVPHANPTTQPAAAKLAVNLAKTTPQDCVNSSVPQEKQLASRANRKPMSDRHHDGDSKLLPNILRNIFRCPVGARGLASKAALESRSQFDIPGRSASKLSGLAG